jgi:hypothetical protein
MLLMQFKSILSNNASGVPTSFYVSFNTGMVMGRGYGNLYVPPQLKRREGPKDHQAQEEEQHDLGIKD